MQQFSVPARRLAALLLLVCAVSGSNMAFAEPASALSASFDCTLVTGVSRTECEALVVLYNTTGGAAWTHRAGWLSTSTPCSWHGIHCSGGAVSQITLSNNHLTGHIPAELSNLAGLRYLLLDGNELTGSIPAELGHLARLEGLYLYNNQLTGSIPAELGQATNLLDLELSNNRLTGSIPAELGNLTRLIALLVDGNPLEGSIPMSLTHLTALEYFYFNNTSLCELAGPAFDDWTAGILDVHAGAICEVLPVELVSFDALTADADVQLSWRTASEQNNSGFEVQQQAVHGAEGWRDVAFVEGHGTTAEPRAYRYAVTGLAPGTYRFRLKQIDFDGRVEYGPEVEATVEMVGSFVLAPAYPNPFNPQTRFSLTAARAQQVQLGVFDAMGRRVALLFDGVLPAQQAQAFEIDAASWPSGMYFIRATGGRFSAVQKIVLLR